MAQLAQGLSSNNNSNTLLQKLQLFQQSQNTPSSIV